MTDQLTIEMAPFSVASEISEAALLAASERLEREFLSESEGYLGRVLVHKAAGEWADIVFWNSEAQAAKAMQAAGSNAACLAYFECMQAQDHADPNDGVLHFRAVRTYGSLAN